MSVFSLAGGCFLALACDYRIMVGPKYLVGLNETQLGIAAPFWIQVKCSIDINPDDIRLSVIKFVFLIAGGGLYSGS